MTSAITIYTGEVVHVRQRPRRHRLRYKVFSLGMDVDRLDEATASLRLFSHNRFNLISFHDRDIGDPDERDQTVAASIRSCLTSHGLQDASGRIELICYPRLWGYVFNPLSVFLCHRLDGELGAVVYEVTNTVGERVRYVIEAEAQRSNIQKPEGKGPARLAGVPADFRLNGVSCAKSMYVSPFTPAAGCYGFSLRRVSGDLTIGVHLHDAEGALLRTHFRGQGEPATDSKLAAAIATHPLMTIKVIVAIHYEAAKLFLKGVPVVQRHVSPRYSVRLARANTS